MATTKVTVTVKKNFETLTLNGVDLRVYADGNIDMYCTVANQYYKIGWNRATGNLDTNRGKTYRKIGLHGKLYRWHRVVYLAFNPNWDITDVSCDNQIDHINGNTLDNSIANLRIVTNGQNQRNAQISRTNTSGLKGFYYRWDSKCRAWYWTFSIKCNGKSTWRYRRIPDCPYGKDEKHLVESEYPFFPAFVEEMNKLRDSLHGDYARLE
jgi:hypothetical protein